MIWLSISIVALISGVTFSGVLDRSTQWKMALHGFVVGFIGLLLFIEVMPHTFEHIGWQSVLWFLSGFALMTGLDHFSMLKKEWLSSGLLAIVFGLHSLVDGLALGTHRDGMMLALAIVAHRFPAGLVLAEKAPTSLAKWGILAVMILTSLVGFFWVEQVPFASLALIQALAGGGLAHVLFEHETAEETLHCGETCHPSDAVQTDISIEGTQNVVQPRPYSNRFWRMSGFLLSFGLYRLIFFIHEDGEHSSHGHGENLVLFVLVTILLATLVWWERSARTTSR